MNILIAGGAGYIGSVLTPILIEHGYNVDVVDTLWFGNHLPGHVGVIEQDLFQCTERSLEHYDQVIFLAGLSNDPMAEFSPSANFVYNAALPSYLAFVAKKAGIKRFIYASSCSVYGYTVNTLYDESAPVTCTYPYGISKLQGERGVMQLADDSFSAIALRQGTVCGYSPRMRFDLVVNTMYMSSIRDSEIYVRNPSIWRPIIDVRDAAMAYLRAIQADFQISGVFNIAGGNYTIGHVGDVVKDELERISGTRINITVGDVNDARNYKVECEKAQITLGFHPKFSLKDIVDSVHTHVDSYGDFSNPSYFNIEMFKKTIMDKRVDDVTFKDHFLRVGSGTL